jgi:hypothetical protein
LGIFRDRHKEKLHMWHKGLYQFMIGIIKEKERQCPSIRIQEP